MSAPRPYGTDPFHPLGSVSNMEQFLYIYNSVTVISSMWYVQMFVYDNCACALNLTSGNRNCLGWCHYQSIGASKRTVQEITVVVNIVY